MSKTNLERRINFDDESGKILDALLLESVFKKLDIIDIFAIALIYGKNRGRRTKLGKKKTGRVRRTTIDNSNVLYLMMAIGVEETGNMEILAKRDDYFKICEEYAKTGLPMLQEAILDNPKDFLDNIELKALEFFDKNIEGF